MGSYISLFVNNIYAKFDLYIKRKLYKKYKIPHDSHNPSQSLFEILFNNKKSLLINLLNWKNTTYLYWNDIKNKTKIPKSVNYILFSG
jgi:hypothetical protein